MNEDHGMHPAPPDSPTARTPAPRTALVTTAALAVSSLTLLLLVALEWDPLLTLDGDIARATHRRAVSHPDVTDAMRILSDWIWDPWTMRALATAVALVLLLRRQWWPALWLAATCLVGTLAQQGLKAAVDRPRPRWPDPVDSAHYAAFPSGHAMTAAVVCGALLWLLHLRTPARPLWRSAALVAAVSVVGVGLTRVWLGVHWPSDVLGGWLLGALVVSAAIGMYGYGSSPALRNGKGSRNGNGTTGT